jgi:hypothetical protein
MITDEKITELKAAHPGRDLYLISQPAAGELVIKVPTLDEYQRFLDELNDADTKAHAARVLVFTAVVHPPAAEFRQLVERKPGIINPIADEIAVQAGLKAVTERKKL